jgi:hypothetical protein
MVHVPVGMAIPPDTGGAAGARSVRTAVCDALLNTAVIVAEWVVEEVPAEIGKVALSKPAGTVIAPGTERLGDELERVTAAPALGAGADNTAVHVDVAPVASIVGAQDTPMRETAAVAVGCTRIVVWTPPPSVAVNVAVCVVETLVACAVKLAVTFPIGIETFAGTVIAAELLDNDTVAPPLGAACDNVTVHDTDPPAATVPAAHEIAVTVGAI